MKKRVLILSLSIIFLTSAWNCFPPEHPAPENPPCLKEVNPKRSDTIPRKNLQITLKFSKPLEPSTVNSETIYLVEGEVDLTFLRDLESPPVSEYRLERLVPLDIQLSDDGTTVTVKAKKVLRGDTIYQLVLTRKIKDKLVKLSENRSTGLRPLNFCPNREGIWEGSLDDYKRGRSIIITYTTEPEPPRPGTPKISEVMATPSVQNGEYVEIANAHKSQSLDICGLFLSDGQSTREIIPFPGRKCPKIPPGRVGVILEPDYNFGSNPYKIPSGTPVFTTKGSSSTLLSGGLSSGEPVQLLQGQDMLEEVSPSKVTSGSWPSGKALEKCDINGPNDSSNWTATAGSPGRVNRAQCK